MEENKNTEVKDEDLQEVEIKEEAAPEDNKMRLKKRIFNLIYDLVILIGIGCLVYGGYSLYEGYRDSQESAESYENLENDYVQVPTLPSLPNKPNGPGNSGGSGNGEDVPATQVPERPREWYEQIRVDIVGMQQNINPDIIGWIHFENESISYPLLYSEDNAEYQRVRYDQVYSRGGSIFLEANNKWNLSDIRNVIYGHNMKDLSMFGKLKYYNQKKNYYNDHQYFQLIYGGMVYRYQIFSYFTIHQSEVMYVDTGFKKGSESYGKFLEKLVDKSDRDTGIQVDANDKTVTLVTCAPDNVYRFIVNAVLVDKHTMANADGTFPDDPDKDEPGTDPDTEIDGTEPDTEEPGDTEPDTEEPGDTEPDDTEDPGVRPGADIYTYTEIGKTMMATVTVKIRNKPSTEGVKLAYLGKHHEVYVESVCNETGWYRVRYGTSFRKVGYINAKYLTEENLHVFVPTETVLPTCTTEGVLSHVCECGEVSHTEPIAPRHTETFEGAGTTDVHSMCTVCGAVASTEHVYTDTETTAPTCTTTGVMTHTCACGYSYTSEIPVRHVEEYIGEEAQHSKCTLCGTIITEHSYTDTVTTPPGCDTTGVMTHTCACGYSYTSEIAPAHTEVNGGEEHVHSKCGVCGVVISTEHSFTEAITKEPTTEEEGIKTHSCTCGYSYEETIPKSEGETETETETETESESKTETESETESEKGTEAESGADEPTEPEQGTEPEPGL